MTIRSLLFAACVFPLASFIVTGAQAQTDDMAVPPQCPPFCPEQGKAHDGFQKRYQDRSHRRDSDWSRKSYDDGKPDLEKAQRRSHHFHKRPHSRKHVRLRFYPRYYDPFYFDRFYYDPYYDDGYFYRYDVPDYSERLTCRQAIAELRSQGYRNVKAYDCRGKSYGFYATLHKKKYKITVRSFDGHITSRKRVS